MDIAFKFENIINKYFGRPTYTTYAENWDNNNERIALLFTACIIKYDKNSTGEIAEKLEYFMEDLFKDNNDHKKISIECLGFLKTLE
jgi:hypothetical protein